MKTADYLTRNQAAAVLGVKTRQLQRYASADDPLVPAVPGGHGKATLYDPGEVGQWLIRRELERLQRAAGTSDPIDYHQERARLTKAQADAVELKNSERRREVASVDLLTYALGKMCAQVVATLDALPGKLKRSLPALTASEIEIARREVATCLNAVSETEIDFDDYDKSE